MKALVRKKIATAVMLATIAGVPTSAHADAVVVTNFMADGLLAMTQAAQAGAATVSAAIASLGATLNTAILSLSSQNQANSERQNTVNKALMEAAQNYDKAYKLQEHAAQIDREYGSADANSVTQSAACAAIAVGGNLATAINEKRENKAAMAELMLKTNTATQDPFEVQRRSLKLHSDYFCSDEDVTRGRCKKQAPAELQNADLKASTLFSPGENMTYGEKQEIAANEYINNLVAASPTPALTPRQEATPHGVAYRAAMQAEHRKLDIAAESLREIVASRKGEPGLGTKVGMPSPDASVMGVMSFYASKFLNPGWISSLSSMGQADQLREQTRMMAFQTWMDWQAYLQAERMETIVAVQLVDQVKNSRSPELETLRRNAQRSEPVAK
ncbi:hypothetical protein ACKF11_13830 [Methylobacillus sp. Pita2]|uniref:hypothetical protein n=1 Tax=Methylobacillus sp. Pita2 TaxID=3383245 RepID=UPI0038B6A36E